MKVLKATGMTVILVLIAVPTRAEDPKAPPSPDALLKALAEAGKPCPEHRKLEPLVGDWTLAIKMWTDPSQSPAEIKGTVERKWIMDGRFLQETVKSEYNGKTFEGLGLWGYDKNQKKFTTVRACGMCGTVSKGFTSCDDSGKKFTCATEECCPLTGQKIKGRDEVLLESNDRIVVNIYKTIQDKEMKVMEIVSTRQK